MNKSAPVLLTFALNPLTEAEGPMRFRGVAYSGGVVPDYGWLGDLVIDLETFSAPDRAVFALIDHDPAQRAGKVTATVTNGRVEVDGEFFDNEHGREVAGLMRQGAPWELSVGIQGETERSEAPRTLKANGQTLTANTLMRNAKLREVSFVSVGADPNTTVAAFARRCGIENNQGDTMPTQAELDAATAEAARLAADLATAKATIEQMTTSQAAMRADLAAIRSAQAADLLKRAGIETPTSEQVAPYLEMTAVQFAAVSMLAKPAPIDMSRLAGEVATAGKAQAEPLTAEQCGAQLLAQFQRKK